MVSGFDLKLTSEDIERLKELTDPTLQLPEEYARWLNSRFSLTADEQEAVFARLTDDLKNAYARYAESLRFGKN